MAIRLLVSALLIHDVTNTGRNLVQIDGSGFVQEAVMCVLEGMKNE